MAGNTTDHNQRREKKQRINFNKNEVVVNCWKVFFFFLDFAILHFSMEEKGSLKIQPSKGSAENCDRAVGR